MVTSTLAAQTKQIKKKYIYFAEQLSLDDMVTSYPSELNQPGYIFYTFSVTPNTVDSIISSQQLGKVAGANVANIRIQLLSVIFDISISQGKLLNTGNESNVTAFHKNDPQGLVYYRLIFLLSTV